MRSYLLISSIFISAASINACDKKAADAPPAAVEPAATDKTPGEADKPGTPKVDEATPKADETKTDEATPKADEVKPPEPAAPPAEFTVVDSPTLAGIPAKPLHGKVNGKAFETATVSVEFSSGDWSLQVSFADKQFFRVILTEDATEPKVGYTLRKEKACCWGYLHHIPEGQTRATSLNAPNGFVVEVTGWDVKPYDESGMMKQDAGVLKGRLAVVYGEDSWVAGTFEAPFEYFGPPPHIAQAIKARQIAEAITAVGAWADLEAPAGVAIEAGAKVWAAARERERWSFGEYTIASIDGKVVTLKGDATTAPGLIRSVPVAADLKGGTFAIAVDHLGPQFAKITGKSNGLFGVKYLNPAGKPRDNEIKPERFVTRAATADAPGLPPIVFFDDADGRRASGLAIAKTASGEVVVLVSSSNKSEVIKVAEDKLTVLDTSKSLKRGQKVEAIAGCGMNSYMPREGKIVEVIEGGIAYKVDADPCKNLTLSREKIRGL